MLQCQSFAAVIVCAAICAAAPQAMASDACSRRAVTTEAEVRISDGTQYRTETWFHSADAAAIRFIRKGGGILAVEGPFAWSDDGSGARLVSDERKSFTKIFALGHQFHALLMYFDEIMSDVQPVDSITFRGGAHRGKKGRYPHGGFVYLIRDSESSRSLGVKLEFEGSPPMEITFGDWRKVKGRTLPFHVRIYDGDRIFDYHYTKIDFGEKPSLWFMDALAARDLDEIGVYRLHRQLLAAHCLGDASMIARLTSPNTIIANRGELSVQDSEKIKAQFERVFGNLRYTEYHDLSQPIIEIAKGGDLAWAGVKVRAVGTQKADGKPFDDQWAWIMLARKTGGKWLNAGIASSRR